MLYKIRWAIEDFCEKHKKLWWVGGFKSCYAEHPDGIGAFCKRRPYHLGKHRTGAACTWHRRWRGQGVCWKSRLKLGHTPGNCRCGNYHRLTDYR